MFVIISYIDKTYENLNLVTDIEGNPMVFGSQHTAEKEAKEVCAWNYKIVEL